MTKAEELSDVCEELDALAIQRLQLMNESIGLGLALESTLQDGWMQLAKTRMILGVAQSRAAQLDDRDTQATARVDVSSDGHFALANPADNGSDKGSGQVDDVIKKVSPFGVLTPMSAKLTEKRFGRAIELACEQATTHSALVTASEQYKVLIAKKKQLQRDA